MKIRSTKFRQYLIDRDLLNSSEERIREARSDYNKMYLKEWRSQHTKINKELRPMFTLRQYSDIKLRAKELKLSPTRYLKWLALNHERMVAPDSDILKEVLQKVTMVLTNSAGIYELNKAESMLLEYIKKYNGFN